MGNDWMKLYAALNNTKRKVFVSYYHKDDQGWRDKFERDFGHLFISKSVQLGDIDSDVSTEYVKQLIRKDYVSDASVVIVLLGPKTKCRKHVDWEIYAGLDAKANGHSGLLGILLPTHPDAGTSEFKYVNVPDRYADNAKTDFAITANWPSNDDELKDWIEKAFNNRIDKSDKIDNSRIQMQRNTCD